MDTIINLDGDNKHMIDWSNILTNSITTLIVGAIGWLFSEMWNTKKNIIKIQNDLNEAFKQIRELRK